MEAPRLKPLGIGQVLDVGINVYAKHLWTFVRIVLIIVVPVQIVSALIRVSALPDTHRGLFQTQTSSFDSNDVWAVIAGTLAILVIGLLATAVVTGACFKAVADAYLGREPHWQDSLRFAARRAHSILWVTFLGGLLSALAVVLLVAGAIYFWIAFTVAVPVLLMEGTRGSRALGRSRRGATGARAAAQRHRRDRRRRGSRRLRQHRAAARDRGLPRRRRAGRPRRTSARRELAAPRRTAGGQRPADRLPSACVSAYLRAKARARL